MGGGLSEEPSPHPGRKLNPNNVRSTSIEGVLVSVELRWAKIFIVELSATPEQTYPIFSGTL